MVRKLVWLAVFFIPALSHAQSVQIVQGDHTGSGSVIWRYPDYPDYGQILTCWHVINSSDPVVVIGKKADGSSLSNFARVLAFDKSNDIALLDAHIGSTPAIVVAPTTPPVGTKVVITGFGENIYTERPASIQAIENGLIRLDRPSRHGDSGGAITHDGRLIGISKALRFADYDGLAVPAENIREFLAHKAGWVFKSTTIGPPPPDTQPAPQQQPAPSKKPNGGGVVFARMPDPSPAPPPQNPTDQRGSEQAAVPPLSPPAAGLPGALQPAAAVNPPIAANQQPANPQMVQGNRVRIAASDRPSGRRFGLPSILMGSILGVSLGAFVFLNLLRKRARKNADEAADGDDEPRDRTTQSRSRKTSRDNASISPHRSSGVQKDDEWFAVWFKGDADPPRPPEGQPQRPGTSRRKNRPRN